ncbi:MAG: acetylglutamate kinase [Gemmatimonadaceae bacterium]
MTRVVKIGGRVQRASQLVPTLAAAWHRSPGALAVVHGGGDEVTELQRRLGQNPEFIDGRRVTTAEDIALLRMTLSGVVNKRLAAAFVAAGVPAVGISGEDAGLLSAEPIDAKTMGHAGYPSGTDVQLVRHLLAGAFLPVISPLARDAGSSAGDALNVNGDDAAAAIAVALGATELLLVADVPGVMQGDTIVPTLDAEAARALVASGAATAGMIAKLEAANRALAAGISRVRIGDLGAVADEAAGTRIIGTTTLQSFTPAFA